MRLRRGEYAMHNRPAFLITIDTEGDNQWGRESVICTKNANYLTRFQKLCERFGLRPTWLTNWEMANCSEFQEFGRDMLARGGGEIGMHLHAWNSPPEIALTADDYKHHPYLIEYSEHIIREKVKVMTDKLEDVFETKMVSHRAGRFSFNEIYAKILVEHGYLVDGSVTPGVSWKSYPGDPNGCGGTDFNGFPADAYFLNLDNIQQPGNSPLLEIPVTITQPRYAAPIRQLKRFCASTKFSARVARHFFPDLVWLYPKGFNHRQLPLLLDAVLHANGDYAEFMIHSSELMPGGSPRYPTERSIEELYDVLEVLFEKARKFFVPTTMKEYYDRVNAGAMRRTSHPDQLMAAVH